MPCILFTRQTHYASIPKNIHPNGIMPKREHSISAKPPSTNITSPETPSAALPNSSVQHKHDHDHEPSVSIHPTVVNQKQRLEYWQSTEMDPGPIRRATRTRPCIRLCTDPDRRSNDHSVVNAGLEQVEANLLFTISSHRVIRNGFSVLLLSTFWFYFLVFLFSDLIAGSPTNHQRDFPTTSANDNSNPNYRIFYSDTALGDRRRLSIHCTRPWCWQEGNLCRCVALTRYEARTISLRRKWLWGSTSQIPKPCHLLPLYVR